jgi:hypothetical protein
VTASYNGWPTSQDPAAIGIDRDFEVAGVEFPGGVRGGDVAAVLGYVFGEMHKRVEPLVPGWCWGYTYKANVNNPSQMSCHASGTAGDYNAPNHPNGTSTGPGGGGGWTGAQYAEINAILAEVDHAVDWLSGNDPMHFEIDVDAGELARVAASLPETEDDMPLNDADKAWIVDAIADGLTKALRQDKVIITDDRAATPNDYAYTFETGIERILRITTGTYVGESGSPHND